MIKQNREVEEFNKDIGMVGLINNALNSNFPEANVSLETISQKKTSLSAFPGSIQNK